MTRAHFAFYDPRGALGRLLVGIGVAFASGVGLRALFSWRVAMLGGWSAGGFALLWLAWHNIRSCGPEQTRERAAADDPGRHAVYALVIATSAASLLAATALVGHAGEARPGESLLLLALCLSTVALAWTMTHTAFALRYAHLYYREDDEGVGGVEFPGGAPPCFEDFAYLAFTIGMCFQVSDTAITSRQFRSTILVQAALSFFYNSAILAFVLNLVFGRAS
jgi:uncharacterized membrane protein